MKKLIGFLLMVAVAILPCEARRRWIPPMASSAKATYSTTFNSGAQAPIGAPWVSPVSTSAQCNQTGGSKLEAEGSNALAVLNGSGAPVFNANQSATITLDSTDSCGPGVRFSSSTGVGYRLYITGAGAGLVLKNSSPSANTQVGGDITLSSHASGDTITLSASGTSTVTLTVYVNGVSQGSVSDSSSPIASGQPAYTANGFQTITAFSATDL